MTAPTVWHAGEPCPDSGAALMLLEGGTGPARAECGSCGYAGTWTVTGPAGGDR